MLTFNCHAFLDHRRMVNCSPAALSNQTTNTSSDHHLCQQVSTSSRCFGKGHPATVLLVVVTVYVQLTVAFYEFKRWRTSRRPFFNVNRLYLVSVSMSLLFAVTYHINVIQLFPEERLNCEAFDVVVKFAFALGTICIHTVLWERQRAFYTDPLLKGSNTRCLVLFSRMLIVGIVISIIALVVGFHLTHCRFQERGVCIMYWPQSSDIDFLPSTIAIVATSFVVKLALLYLMVRPLLRLESVRAKHCCLNLKMEKDIRSLISRLVVCMTLCIISSAVVGTVFVLIANALVCPHWEITCGYDLAFSTVAVICTYADGLMRLCPVTAFREPRQQIRLFSVSSSSGRFHHLCGKKLPQANRATEI